MKYNFIFHIFNLVEDLQLCPLGLHRTVGFVFSRWILRRFQVSNSVPQILVFPRKKNPRLFQIWWKCRFILYICFVFEIQCYDSMYSVLSQPLCVLPPTVTSWEMSCGLSWNTWLEVLWQTWWRKPAWMKARLQLCAAR